jgi:hypothetical protein
VKPRVLSAKGGIVAAVLLLLAARCSLVEVLRTEPVCTALLILPPLLLLVL